MRMPDPMVLRKLMPERVTITVTPLAPDTLNSVEKSRTSPQTSWLSSDDACCNGRDFRSPPNPNVADSTNSSFSMVSASGQAVMKEESRWM